MTEQPATAWDRAARSHARWRVLARPERITALVYAGGFLGVVLVALWLDPDPRGVGTHEQLGLPPCTTQLLFHIPCPFCGMTTAFSLMVHGQPAGAFYCQPAGAVGFVMGALVALGAALVAATGRFPTIAARLFRSKTVWAVGISIILAAWIYKIVTFV